MKEKIDPKEWADEFKTFMDATPVAPPQSLRENILNYVHKELNPSAVKVFSKISLIHVGVGFISLLMCPQFGFSPLGNMGLMSLLMKYGNAVCMLGCGAVFVGGTALISSFVLKPEEVRVLRKTEALQFAVLSILSIGAFLCLGAEVLEGLTLIWMLGSLVGGLLSLEIGWVIRKKILFA